MRRVTLSFSLLSMLILLTLTTFSTDAQGETVRIVVYRSADSLTLYLPDVGFPDITGLYIEATTAIGETVRRDLALLPAFRGLPYNRLPAPICFHLISASSATLPLDCQTTTTLTQLMAAGDIFWHEQGDRTLVFYLGEIPQICPAGAPRCTLVFPALPTPTPTATSTPTNTATATATATATFTPTNTPTTTATATAYFTPTNTPVFSPSPALTVHATSQVTIDCGGARPSYYGGGDIEIGITVFSNAFSQRQPVRSIPSLAGDVITAVGGDTRRYPMRYMVILDGPVCADGYRWWQIQVLDSGQIGWAVDHYFTIPSS